MARVQTLPPRVRAALGAQLLSITGLGAQTVVLVLVALDEYGSPAVLAALVTARSLGTLAGFPFASWLVSRFGALICAAATHVVFALWAVLLGALMVSGSPVWALVVLSFVLGAAMAVDSPARRTGIADLAGAEHAPSALAWLASSTWVGRMLGAAVGSALWALAPMSAFVFNGGTYLVPAALFFMWRSASPPLEDPPARPAPWRSAARLARSGQPALLCASLAAGGMVVEFGVFAAVLVEHHATGAVALSLLEVVMTGGAVAAGFIGARRPPVSYPRAVTLAWLVAATGAAGLAAPWLWLSAADLALCAGGVTYVTAMTTAALVRLEGELRSDALAASGAIVWVATAAAAPLLVFAADVSMAVLAGAVTGGLVAAAAVAWRASLQPTPAQQL